jgi:hypothetical protein
MTPEGKVKAYLRDRIRALGGEIRFAKWIGRSHCPDCFVMLTDYPVTLVETKAPGKRPRPGQVREIERLRKFGVRVLVLPTIEDIDREFPL